MGVVFDTSRSELETFWEFVHLALMRARGYEDTVIAALLCLLSAIAEDAIGVPGSSSLSLAPCISNSFCSKSFSLPQVILASVAAHSRE